MSLINAMSSYSVMDMLAADKENNQKETVNEMFSRLVKEKTEEYIEKIQSGSLEESFQIGAGSYTEKEWNKLLRSFDIAQAKLNEAADGTEKETQQTNKTDTFYEDNETKEKSVEMLFAEFTTAVYPAGDKDADDDIYYTFYTPDGIYCRKQGESGFEWQISFEDESQYQKVMSYLKDFDSQDNLRFACHESFWQDFLNDNIDMNKFSDFLETRVTDGVPNYLNVYENGVNIDAEAAEYSQYMNIPDFVKEICYTSEEALATILKQRPAGKNKQPDHEVIDINHMDKYYAQHPEEIGKKNQYYNGRWYSMAELVGIWNKELEGLFDTNS